MRFGVAVLSVIVIFVRASAGEVAFRQMQVQILRQAFGYCDLSYTLF
jgi:hypothetical protein